MKRFSALSLGCLLMVTVNGVGAADLAENPALNETFSFRLGAAYLSGSADVGADLKGGPVAPDISFDDIGIDGAKPSPYLGARWRFFDRFRAEFEYFGWHEDGSRAAVRSIEFGDIAIPVGAQARGKLDVDVYVVSLGWSFLANTDYEAGVQLGVHVADLAASIEGSGFVGGLATAAAKESAEVTAPLPNVGVFGSYALSPEWSLQASAGYFSLFYDQYDGDLLVATAALEYRFTEHFGAGAGYSLMQLDLSVDGDRIDEHYDFSLHGPTLFLTAGF